MTTAANQPNQTNTVAATSGAITTFLWFDKNAEEAVNFYVSVFPNSGIDSVKRYPAGAPYAEGSVMTVEFHLNGAPFIALNGGPEFRFTPAISLSIDCAGQDDVDYYWARLCEEGGKPVQCGWLEDRYGLSWQVVPSILPRLLGSDDRKRATAAMRAMMDMVKLDVAALQAAYDQA